MKKILLLALFVCLNGFATHAQERYSDRVDTVRIFFENLVTNRNYCSAHAMIMSGTQREAGLAMLDTLLIDIGYAPINRFRMAALYLHSRDSLLPEHRERIRSIFAHEPILPPHEEYEKLVYYTAIKLMSEQFADIDVWFNGKTAEENNRNASSFIERWIRESTSEGQQMFDSPTYGSAMIVSMLLLHQYSTDTTLAKKARVMASWLLSDFALDNIDGQYAGAHGKESNQSAMFPLISDMSQMGWLYFGDGIQLYGLEQYFAAIADFELEPEIVVLARDRKTAYESYETKRSGSRLRGDDSETYPIQKYTYMAPLYAVGSVPGGLHFVGEQHSWDVTWISRSRNSSMFSLHPYAAPQAVGEFMPHPPDNAYAWYTRSDQFYATASKSVGGSPYESLLQYKSTMIALYDIPEDLPRFPFMAAYLPLNTRTLDIDSNRTKWITMDVGDVYIAIYPLKPYNIFPEENGRRLYSRGGKTGLIVQVAGKNEVGAYKTFRTKVRKTKINASKFDSEGVVSYTSIFGDKLEARYGTQGLVNGSQRVFPADMLFSSPHVASTLRSGVMTVQGKNTTLTLDANTGTIHRNVK